MHAGVRVFGGVRLRWALIVALLLGSLAGVGVTPAQGAVELPPGFSDELVAEAFQPTGFTFTPDGRMLVLEKPGRVKVFRDGVLLNATDLGPQICSEWERGLVGVAVDPEFGIGANRTIYLYYTHNKKGVCPLFNDPDRLPVSEFPENRVSKFQLNEDNTVDIDSEVVLVDHIPSPGIHNSGHLAFGPVDKLLYVSVGDGGCVFPELTPCQSRNTNARRTDLLLGKILRINKDGTFPPTNPYAGDSNVRRCGDPAGIPAGTGRCGEIFSTGLRNPFRFTFQPGTQTFYINDVGTSLWEEVDKGAKGADFGFNLREGHCANNSDTDCDEADGSTVGGLTNPIFDYHHDTECSSITGGAFVPAGLWPAPYSGSYLFGDFVCGTIFRMAPKSGGGYDMVPLAEGLGANSVVHMEFGPFGGTQALYYSHFGDGAIRRISNRSLDDTAPTASFTATPRTSSSAPLAVTFNGGASTDPDNDDLDFLWNFGDGSPVVRTEGPTTAHTFTSEGSFNVTLRVEDDRHTSAPATQVIEVGDPPTATIVSPSTSARFKINDPVTLTAAGTDPDETLASSQFSWTVIRHHNNSHTHPFLGPITGKTLSFFYPEPEDLDAAKDSKLEAILTVTDSSGIKRTVSRDLMPRRVQITIKDDRSTALRLWANDLSYEGEGTFLSWPGYRIQLHAPSPQQFSGRYYEFESWSDGGARTHDIITGTSSATFTASFDRHDGTAPTPPPPPPPPPAPTGVMGIARTKTGSGYWLASDEGKVRAFGDATHWGDASNLDLNKPIAGMAATPSGHGYWLVATDGGIFSYGDARFWGSTGSIALNKPVVGMAATPSGNGYWLVAADGGIFAFGDARFKGSTGSIKLNKPVVGMESTPSGDGYWLMASDGGVFAFTDAGYHGGTGADPPGSMGVGMVSTPDGGGYWLAFLDSTVAAFGNAQQH